MLYGLKSTEEFCYGFNILKKLDDCTDLNQNTTKYNDFFNYVVGIQKYQILPN